MSILPSAYGALCATTVNTTQGTGPVLDSSLVTNLSNSDLFGFTYEDSSGVVSSELYGNTAVAGVTFSPQIVLSKFAPVIDKSTALSASGTIDNDGDTVNDLVANSPTGLTVKWFYNNAGVDTVFAPSAADWVDGGCNLDESIILAKKLDELGCSYDLSPITVPLLK